MKDKYGEIIICTNCRMEIKDKQDLKINNKTGLVYCEKCYNMRYNVKIKTSKQNFEKDILGHRDAFTIPPNDDQNIGWHDNTEHRRK